VATLDLQREARRIVMQELGAVLEIMVIEDYRIEAGTGRALGEAIGERIDERLSKVLGGST
jgi:hypothetical protein